ncbi:MAG: tRNA lysidine(34) synthetase TilS, partial [Chloroflexi bacterium]|nr:tRNA lysidine(34) synthetase TilS [Chloroflexota bacterium]
GRGALLVVEQETCALGAASTERIPLVSGPLAVPGVTHAGPWIATVSAGEPRELDPAAVTGKGWRAALDADQAGAGLRLRARARGDRFQPLGMDQPVRLQDVLVNAKVPRGERDDLPLVVSDRGIAWVPGVRVAQWAVVTAATRRVVEVSLERGAQARD